MTNNNILSVFIFNMEIGKLAFDSDASKSYFQYNAAFLLSEKYKNLFPFLIKRITQTQIFTKYNNDTFKGLPPVIADSLPDVFGNMIFKTWLSVEFGIDKKISILEQLAYVANRGMGALEFKPTRKLNENDDFDFKKVVTVLEKVMQNKLNAKEQKLNADALLNIFKIGSSAGGARPKILIAEHKNNGSIIPGDLAHSEAYWHYIVKLNIDADAKYNQEHIEYSYYLTALKIGINMMPSKLIENKHFATQRFDRQHGNKQHVLTASGLTGWDFKNPEVSTYENLFLLALNLKISQKEIVELFTRMVFNVVFCNTDDHLKNHSFIFNPKKDTWHLAPAYDLTYALNPLINFTNISRALAINNKRANITIEDIKTIAEKYTIKNITKIITDVQNAIPYWETTAITLKMPKAVIKKIKTDFKLLL